MAALGNAEELRTEARAIKERTMARLDEYLEHFATQAQRVGCRCIGRTTRLTRQIITGIAQLSGRVIVKGKSMATEEIHLNPHPSSMAEVVETDLGEYIIQLAGETPPHHCPGDPQTRQQIAMFCTKSRYPYTEVIPEMTQIARRPYAQFLRADLGIIGANFDR